MSEKRFDPKNVFLSLNNEIIPESEIKEFIGFGFGDDLASVTVGISGGSAYQIAHPKGESITLTLMQGKYADKIEDLAENRTEFLIHIREANKRRAYTHPNAIISNVGDYELGNSDSGHTFTILVPGITKQSY